MKIKEINEWYIRRNLIKNEMKAVEHHFNEPDDCTKVGILLSRLHKLEEAIVRHEEEKYCRDLTDDIDEKLYCAKGEE